MRRMKLKKTVQMQAEKALDLWTPAIADTLPLANPIISPNSTRAIHISSASILYLLYNTLRVYGIYRRSGKSIQTRSYPGYGVFSLGIDNRRP